MQPQSHQPTSNHVAGQPVAGEKIPDSKQLQCTVQISKDGDTLMGYACTDGTFQFLLDGKLQEFETIPDIWKAWSRLA